MFTVKVSIGNAAFVEAGPGFELSRILRKIADQVEMLAEDDRVQPLPGETPVRDANGNRVGFWALD